MTALTEGEQNLKIRIGFIDVIVLLSCFLSFSIIITEWDSFLYGGALLTLFPCLFVSYYLVVKVLESRINYKYTVLSYTIVQWIRFVIIPATMALSQEKVFYSTTNLNWSLWLLLFEFLASSLFLCVASLRKIRENHDKLYLKGNKYVYIVFIFFASMLFLYYTRKGFQLLNFIKISVGNSERSGDLEDTGLVLVRQIITCSFTFAFLIIVSFCEKRYQISRSNKYIYYSIIAAIAVVLVIVGERRSHQIYTAITTAYILVRVFHTRKRIIVTSIFGSALFVLALMSLYKFSYAFLYASYGDALKATSFSMQRLSLLLQSYFGGPNSLINIFRYADNNSNNIFDLFFDFGRSIAPISFLLKGSRQVTSVLYNQYLYRGLQNTGHVLTSTGYGYVYGGPFLCPWVMILNLLLAMIAEKQLKQTNSIEMTYVWMIIMLRFCVNLYANTPALLSAASLALLSYSLCYIGAKAVNDLLGGRRQL